MAKRNAEVSRSGPPLAGCRKRTIVTRSVLAGLATAWLHGWAQRQDQAPTWQDAAVLAGLGAAWLLERAEEKKQTETEKAQGVQEVQPPPPSKETFI